MGTAEWFEYLGTHVDGVSPRMNGKHMTLPAPRPGTVSEQDKILLTNTELSHGQSSSAVAVYWKPLSSKAVGSINVCIDYLDGDILDIHLANGLGSG